MINYEDLQEAQYFTVGELASPDDVGSWVFLNRDFLFRLAAARHSAGIPFVLSSCVRTPDHNKAIGGVSDSSHLSTTKGGACAADIKTTSSSERYKILTALQSQGITRFGIGENFIHCDSSKTKSKEVIWDYY